MFGLKGFRVFGLRGLGLFWFKGLGVWGLVFGGLRVSTHTHTHPRGSDNPWFRGLGLRQSPSAHVQQPEGGGGGVSAKFLD